MHNDFFMLQEARMRQKDLLRDASQVRLVMEARAASKPDNAGIAGILAAVLFYLGSQLVSAGRRLQERYGPPPVKAY